VLGSKCGAGLHPARQTSGLLRLARFGEQIFFCGGFLFVD
jgi:hypothetical protein